MGLRDSLIRYGALSRGSRINPSDSFAFKGGLSLVDPPLVVEPGRMLGAKNYEPGIRGGYTRVQGFERFDGRESPTNGTYVAVTVPNAAGGPFAVGDIIRQYPVGTSTTASAVAEVAYVAETATAGEWVFVAVLVTGTFVAGEDIRIGSPSPGTLAGTSSSVFVNSALIDADNETYILNKADYLRAKISPVGDSAASGPCRGGAIYKNRIVAFRDNAAGTAGGMWESTPAGWAAVPLGFQIRFDTGSKEVFEGDTITGLSSGATAVVKRIVSSDGMWSIGDASGYFIASAISGTFTANETLRVSGVAVARFLSANAQVLPPGGRYRYRVHNFFGSQDKRRLYVTNGVGNAFEWDGETFTFIETGAPNDKPQRLFVINDHLGLCYPGGSIQTSGFQLPLNWNPVFGADERSVGSDVTDVIEETNREIFIGTRFQTYLFSGDVLENFQLRIFSVETGIIPDTLGKLGPSIFLDDRGFTTLQRSQAAGNFQAASISDAILPAVQKIAKTLTIPGAVISRSKNMYRCFFSDGSGLAISSRPNANLSGWTPLSYPASPFALFSGEVDDGVVFGERSFLADNNGYLYELDIGRSFDGADIEAFLKLAYHHSGSPETVKHYRKAVIDMDIQGPTNFFMSTDFNYGKRSGNADSDLSFDSGGGAWDIAAWGEFKWSQQAFDQLIVDINGSGFNIGLFFYGKSNNNDVHTLYNATYHVSRRRIQRGNQDS